VNEETPLTQFQEWYGSRARAGLDGQSEYVKFREAFFAGYAARPRPPIEPSRDALIDKTSRMARYYRGTYLPSPQYDDLPPSDYIQRGTVTGRMPPFDYIKTDFPQRTPQPPREDFELRAGPGPETLGRIHDKLRDTGQVDYPVEPPADSTNPGFPAVTRSDTKLMPALTPDLLDDPAFEHTDTVWNGQYGAPGPVPTPLSVQERENG
jgi:hypothetical protein